MTKFFRRLRKLRVLGWASAALFVAIAASFWAQAFFKSSVVDDIIICVCAVALAVLYFVGMRHVREAQMRDVVIFGALFALIGFISVPFDSTDVFYYMAQGWGQTHYNANPYSNVLRDIPDGLNDPMIGSAWMTGNVNPWLDEPLPYGFVFAWITRGIAFLGSGYLWPTLALFTLFNLLIHASVTYLLWKTSSLLPNGDGKLVVYLYAWNPLVVLQFLANVHNDIIMGALIVLAFYLMMTRKTLWVLPTLIAAGLVKFVALALAPFAMIWVSRRHGWKPALKGLALGVAIAVAISVPYLRDFRSFKFHDLVVQLTESKGSLHAFIVLTARAVARVVHAPPLDLATLSWFTTGLLWLVVAVFTAREMNRSWTNRRGDMIEVSSRWTAVMFVVIFIGSSQFYAWYIGMLLPLALLGAGSSALTDAVVLLSGTHMLGFTFVQRKSMGYSLVSTALPLAILLWQRHKSARSAPLLAPCLSVVKPGEASVGSGLHSEPHGEFLTS